MSDDFRLANASSTLRTFWREWRALILFLVLMTLFRSALADWNDVPTGSMQPTIVEGDRILVNKMAYDIRIPFTHISVLKRADPLRGDIIIFDSKVSKIRLVKRVVAVPGDVIQMQNNVLIINGKELDYSLAEGSHSAQGSYPAEGSHSFEDRTENLLGVKHRIRVGKKRSRASSFTELSIPPGFYLALGDNRDNSADSRYIGLIPRQEIIGRTKSVVMSLDYEDYFLPRRDRFLIDL